MILGVTGTSHYPFDRLIAQLDLLGKVHQVIIQAGYSTLDVSYAKRIGLIPRSEILALMSEADLVICHGGYGTICDALSLNKLVICVPRLEEFGELIGDQCEVVDYFASNGNLVRCDNLEHLDGLVDELLEGGLTVTPYSNPAERLVSDILDSYVK